jgi:hypothetical protein
MISENIRTGEINIDDDQRKFPPAAPGSPQFHALTQRLAKKIRFLEEKETIVAQLAEIKSIAESRELRQIDAKVEGNDQTRVTSVAFSDGWTAGFKRITKQLEDKLVKVEAGIAELGP